jgi:hypothetical protein
MVFERIAPDTPEWAAYYANHIQRYMFAADRLREAGCRHVLDAACDALGKGRLFALIAVVRP